MLDVHSGLLGFFLELSILAQEAIDYEFDPTIEALGLPEWNGRSMYGQASFLRDTFSQEAILSMFCDVFDLADKMDKNSLDFERLFHEIDALYHALEVPYRPRII